MLSQSTSLPRNTQVKETLSFPADLFTHSDLHSQSPPSQVSHGLWSSGRQLLPRTPGNLLDSLFIKGVCVLCTRMPVFSQNCVCVKRDLHLHACVFIEFNPILLLSKTLILGPGPFRPIKHLNTINSGVAKGSAHTYSPNTGPAEPRHCPLCTRLAFCWSSVVSWCA